MDTKMKFNDFYYSILNDYLDNPNDLKIEEWRGLYFIKIPSLTPILLDRVTLNSDKIPQDLNEKIKKHIEKYNKPERKYSIKHHNFKDKNNNYIIPIVYYYD